MIDYTGPYHCSTKDVLRGQTGLGDRKGTILEVPRLRTCSGDPFRGKLSLKLGNANSQLRVTADPDITVSAQGYDYNDAPIVQVKMSVFEAQKTGTILKMLQNPENTFGVQSIDVSTLEPQNIRFDFSDLAAEVKTNLLGQTKTRVLTYVLDVVDAAGNTL